jgi:hypothetical protein
VRRRIQDSRFSERGKIMSPVVERRVAEKRVSVVQERAHRLRFRLLYYLAVFLIAAVMTGVLWVAST